MKKEYTKPTLARRETLSAVTAIVTAPSGQFN
jgi:hypothetical protein